MAMLLVRDHPDWSNAKIAKEVGKDKIRTCHENEGTTRGSVQSGAESGADGARQAQHDPQLATVIAAWHILPDAVKAGIVAMVKATHGGNF